MTKAPIDLATHFHWHGDAFTDGQVIDTITPRRGNKASENARLVKDEPVWERAEYRGHWRAVWQYSRKRAVRDGHTLTAQENRARAITAGDRPERSTRFVTTTSAGRRLGQAGLERARRLAGLKGYVTNIEAATMPAGEVIASYQDLWHVEHSFRMSKADLRARPIFHHDRDAVEAHLTIAFIALAVAPEMQARAGLSLQALPRRLRPLRSATITIASASQTFPHALSPDDQALLKSLTNPGH